MENKKEFKTGSLYIDDCTETVECEGLEALDLLHEIIVKSKRHKDVFKSMREYFAQEIEMNNCTRCGCYTENEGLCECCIEGIQDDKYEESRYDY